MLSIKQRFLSAMQESYQKVQVYGVRSNQKTKILHGWAQEELRCELGNDYLFTGQTPSSSREAKVEGMYYYKKVDILVERDGQELGVVSIKFVISNYKQNSINYFEQQIGETANLRRKNIVYGNIFCITNPIPYKESNGGILKQERLRDEDVRRYVRLRKDHEHAHAPDEMAIGIVDVDLEQNVISGLTDLTTLELSDTSLKSLEAELSIANFFPNMAKRIELRHQSP